MTDKIKLTAPDPDIYFDTHCKVCKGTGEVEHEFLYCMIPCKCSLSEDGINTKKDVAIIAAICEELGGVELEI